MTFGVVRESSSSFGAGHSEGSLTLDLMQISPHALVLSTPSDVKNYDRYILARQLWILKRVKHSLGEFHERCMYDEKEL